VEITLSLVLPRDEMTVPVARHVVTTALQEVGADDDCVSSIEIAVSEACTNVLKHSGPGDEFEVTVTVDETRCVIRVIDTGHGFDVDSLTATVDLSAEEGRGVSLMNALVDCVKLESKPEKGTIVSLEKALSVRPSSLAARALDKSARR
jgi:serine/threonine-protein kinase RsbW